MATQDPSLTPTPTQAAVETIVSTLTTIITATATQTPTVYGSDPYLEFQPAFAYSLPIQFLLTGVILSLCTILLIHLVFTAPYHWPMAKLNYGLQMSGVCALLFSLGITLSVILADVHGTSREWPYMLNYVAVEVPMDNWTNVESGLWYTLDAVTSGLAHTTHIQFLTYLYPSDMERRLIIGMLAPIVLASSFSSFLELSASTRTQSMGDTIKNICNSTLAILFSVALGVWGFFINREEAWRTDGGTAIFGGGALALSLFTMGLNLFQIARVPPAWLPHLIWTIVLWQSFLGWWWYIGSDAPEPRPTPSRGNRKRKGKRRADKMTDDGTDATRLSRVRTRLGLGGDGLRRRKPNASGSPDSEANADESNATLSPFSPPTITSPAIAATSHTQAQSSFWGSKATVIPSSFSSFLSRLRAAHKNAAEQQAVENEMKRFEVYGGAGARGVPGSGWGLGSFAVRPGSTVLLEGEGVAYSRRLDDEHEEEEGSENRRGHVSIPMRDMSSPSRRDNDDNNAAGTSGNENSDSPNFNPDTRRVMWDDEEGEYTDVTHDDTERPQNTSAGSRGKTQRERVPVERLSTPNSSWSWFGPFRRWRLRDVSTFN